MKNKSISFRLKNLSIILLSISNTLAAQEVKPDSVQSKMFNNAIYGNVGNGGLYFTATGYYERMFRNNPQNSPIATFVKVGYGGAAFWYASSSYILGQFGILTGVKKHHFEASAGLVKGIGNDLNFFPLSGSIGYRIQKPDGHFIFRTGVGWPEAVYIGLGVSF
jgi:hypothetical protein